jgi:hypothetical protein
MLINEGHGVEKWVVSIVNVGGMIKNVRAYSYRCEHDVANEDSYGNM